MSNWFYTIHFFLTEHDIALITAYYYIVIVI